VTATNNGHAANGWAPVHPIADPPEPAPRPLAGLHKTATRTAANPAVTDTAADSGPAGATPAPRPARTRHRRRPPGVGQIVRVPARRHVAAAGAIVAVLAVGAVATRGGQPTVVTPPMVQVDLGPLLAQQRADLDAAVAEIEARSKPVLVVSEPLAWSACPLTPEALTMIGVNRDTGSGIDPDRGGHVEDQVRGLLGAGVDLHAMRLVVDKAPNLVVLDGGTSGAVGAALFRCPTQPAPPATAAPAAPAVEGGQ